MAASVLAMGVVAGCGSDDDGGGEGGDGPYRLGVAVALTGPAATFGAEQRDTVQALVDDLNENGGVDGREVEVIVKDTKTDPTEASRVATQLIREEKVMAIFGGTTSSETLAFLPLAAREGVTVLAPGGADEIAGDPDAAHYETTFRVSGPVTADNGVVLDQVRSNNESRIALIVQEDANSTIGAERFTESVKEAGGGLEVVEEVSVAPTATDVSAQVSRVMRAKPDAVYMLMSGADLTAASLRALSDAGFDGGLYGTTGVVQSATIDAAGDTAEGLTAGALVNPDDPAASARLFELMEPFGGVQNHGNWTGAQGFEVFVTGLQSGPANGKELADAIEAAGPIEGYGAAPVDYTGEYHDGLPAEGLIVTQVRDGKWVTLEN